MNTHQVRRLPKKTVIVISIIIAIAFVIFYVIKDLKEKKITEVLATVGHANITQLKVINKLNVEDKDGVFDHTIIDMKKLHVEFGAEPFDASLYLKTPESDPDISTEIKGTIDLGNIMKIVPLEGTTLSGIILSTPDKSSLLRASESPLGST